MNIGVLVSGRGSNLQAILDAIDTKHIKGNISVVISDKSDIYALERLKGKTIASKIVLRADYTSKEEFEDHLIQVLIDHNVELVVLAGFLRVLGSKFIQEFNNRIINIHPSLIPSFCGKGYYGLTVHEKALKRGVKVTGATVHFVDEVLDNGPIILQKAVMIEEGDTPEVLQRRVMEQAEWVILPKAIDLIANGKISVENGIAHIKE